MFFTFSHGSTERCRAAPPVAASSQCQANAASRVLAGQQKFI
jgi:hypothetical protein